MDELNEENTPEGEPALTMMQNVEKDGDYYHNPDVVKRCSPFLLTEFTRKSNHYALDGQFSAQGDDSIVNSHVHN